MSRSHTAYMAMPTYTMHRPRAYEQAELEPCTYIPRARGRLAIGCLGVIPDLGNVQYHCI